MKYLCCTYLSDPCYTDLENLLDILNLAPEVDDLFVDEILVDEPLGDVLAADDLSGDELLHGGHGDPAIFKNKECC